MGPLGRRGSPQVAEIIERGTPLPREGNFHGEYHPGSFNCRKITPSKAKDERWYERGGGGEEEETGRRKERGREIVS